MKEYNFLRGLFIVLLGVSLPLLSGVISLHTSSLTLIAGAFLYFTFSFFCSWGVCLLIVKPLRRRYHLYNHPFLKMLLLCLVTTLISGVLISMATYGWIRQTQGSIIWGEVEPMIYLTLGAAVLFTLLFEVANLSRERAVDIRVVNQLDKKRTRAEIQALKNQLDPHFMFNSLTTLSYLIQSDKNKAELYNSKLAQVYKFFLINKKRALVSLGEELEFIEDYFFLLQIRHGNKIRMEIDIDTETRNSYYILPAALQIPVENAIKHNELAEHRPLLIRISCDGRYVTVSNEMCPKPYEVPSTHVGLENLNRRYWLACHENIQVQKTHSRFIVQLPLIQL